MSTPYKDEETQEPVCVPYGELSKDALQGVIESFVLREGTDYGERDYSLEQKVAHVMRQLAQGDARILFDPNTESIDIQIVQRHSSATSPGMRDE